MRLDNGCDTCASFWLKHPKKQPYRLAENTAEQMLLYQCNYCEAFWSADLRTARVLTLEDAKSFFPNYFNCEN